RAEASVAGGATDEGEAVEGGGGHRRPHVAPGARLGLGLARRRLRLRVVAEDAERPDQVAAKLAIEVPVVVTSLPSEPFERRTDQVADEVAEAIPGFPVDEAIAPHQSGDDRLPDGRVRVVAD